MKASYSSAAAAAASSPAAGQTKGQPSQERRATGGGDSAATTTAAACLKSRSKWPDALPPKVVAAAVGEESSCPCILSAVCDASRIHWALHEAMARTVFHPRIFWKYVRMFIVCLSIILYFVCFDGYDHSRDFVVVVFIYHIERRLQQIKIKTKTLLHCQRNFLQGTFPKKPSRPFWAVLAILTLPWLLYQTTTATVPCWYINYSPIGPYNAFPSCSSMSFPRMMPRLALCNI